MVIDKILRLLARSHPSPMSKKVLDWAIGVQRRVLFTDYDFLTNGEMRYVESIARDCVKKSRVFFDVGANVGDFSIALAKIVPAKDRIFAFEPHPEVFKKLRERVSSFKNITPINQGLDDKSITRALTDSAITAKNMIDIEVFKARYGVIPPTVDCSFIRGDEFMADKGIEKIDFLKLDIEGAEGRALKGFGDRLNQIEAIQFEYGRINIFTKFLLVDFYDLLQNFQIGRIHPKETVFETFDWKQENFIDGNFLARKIAVNRDH